MGKTKIIKSNDKTNDVIQVGSKNNDNINYNKHELTIKKMNIDKIDYDIEYSNDVDYPKISNGYNHFVFQSNVFLFDEINNSSVNENIYLVTEPFYFNTEKNTEGENLSIKYHINNFLIKLDKNIPSIDNNYFCHLWELFHQFPLINEKSKKFISTHYCDKESEFVKATICYRLFINKKNSSSDLYIVNSKHNNKNKFYDYFSKNIKFNSDKLADLITTEIYQFNDIEKLTEQKALPIILNYLFHVLHSQNDGGNLVLKIYETFTDTTFKIIEFLKQIYDKVYMTKPFTSYNYNYEKYLVCLNFDKSKITKNILKKFDEINDSIIDNKDYKIYSIFTNLNIDDSIKNEYVMLNNEYAMIKYKGVNNIRKFLKLDNYHGLEYFDYLKHQHESSKFWCDNFIPS